MLQKKQKQIDFAVNTAGISYKEPLAAMDNQAISESVNTNYLGMINIALAPHLKESKGQLLFFTSSSYTRGRAFLASIPQQSSYGEFRSRIAQEWKF
jgi:2-C-methyl-D-erythritol 4-phosphate cytidylyltransferase